MITGIIALLLQTLVYAPDSAAPAADAAAAASAAAHPNPQSKPFDEAANGDAAVDAALARAAISGKRVIIIMGANWCHDSRALAGWFESPRFAAMLGPLYEIAYVDVGRPQTGTGRNQHLIRRFGGKTQKNTPYVMILSPAGKLLNKKDARSWRNAASRSDDEIYRFFSLFTPA